jgi:drug/metabolite transporter (DMT)-like permease
MKIEMKDPRWCCLLALLCCGLWGSAFPCIKMGYQMLNISGIGSQVLFAGYRFFVAGILTFLFGCILEKRILKIRKDAVSAVFGQGILQTSIQYLFFYIGLGNTSGAKGSIINSISSFISIVAAAIFIKTEKVTWHSVIGCILGFLGVIIINIMPGDWNSSFNFSGEGMLLIASTAYGISNVSLKKIAHKESIFTINAYQMLFGSLILIIIGWIMDGNIKGFHINSLILFLYLALISAVAFTIWTFLLKYNPVSKVTIYGFAIPIFGVLLSGLILSESILNLRNLFALILISLGIIIANLYKDSKKKVVDIPIRR